MSIQVVSWLIEMPAYKLGERSSASGAVCPMFEGNLIPTRAEFVLHEGCILNQDRFLGRGTLEVV